MWQMALSLGTSLIGNYQEGLAEKGYANAMATEKKAQAGSVTEAAKAVARVIRKAGRHQLGQTKAAMAKAGLDVNASAAEDILAEVDQNVESDALSELLTGQRKARTLNNEAAMSTAQAKNAMTRSWLGMGQAGLSAWGNMGGGKS
jgi:hypothetical protein